MPQAASHHSRNARPLVAVLAAAIVALAFNAGAMAQPATAQAEVLFREGKRLMGEGNFKAACEAFEGSYGKDPAVSTLLNLADCREKNQQYASAWAHFVEAGRQARSNPAAAGMFKTAQDRAAAVEARLSYLIINVPDEARLEGLTITRNGIPVEPVEWNRDIPVDGGEYRVEGKAPAYEAWSTTVTIGNAKDKQSVNVPRFREAAALAQAPVSTPAPARGASGKRKVAVGLWVGGAVALATGVGLELKSGSTYDDAKAAIDNAQRHDLTDSANQQRDLAMVAGTIGAVAVGAGVYFWISGRPTDGSVALRPVVGARTAALAVVGTF